MPAAFDFDDFLARAAARLEATPPEPGDGREAGDHVLDPSLLEFRPPGPPREAAVLVPIVARDQPTLLLTRRSDALEKHRGQIAFPGGTRDPEDQSPLATALREAREEIGLSPDRVRMLGYMGAYLTNTGFRVTPVVGLVAPPMAVAPNPAEVAEIFEVPLAFLMSPENHQRHEREWRGKMRRYTAMPYGPRYIWGVTAGIIQSLHRTILGP